MRNNFSKRRVFITDGRLRYKIFDFAQVKSDGSIYVSSPHFSEIKWLAVSMDQGTARVSTVDSPGDGKVSLHGLGMASIRNHKNPDDRRVIIHGNYLLNLTKNQAGVRHLLTAFMSNPVDLPASPADSRLSDCTLHSGKSLSPFVLVFFAVPRIPNLRVRVSGSFHIDDLESIPPETGFGQIELVQHSVVWFADKTKYMNKWPTVPYMCYFDGFTVPLFIGKNEGVMRFELFDPKYELTDGELSISLVFGEAIGEGSVE